MVSYITSLFNSGNTEVPGNCHDDYRPRLEDFVSKGDEEKLNFNGKVIYIGEKDFIINDSNQNAIYASVADAPQEPKLALNIQIRGQAFRRNKNEAWRAWRLESCLEDDWSLCSPTDDNKEVKSRHRCHGLIPSDDFISLSIATLTEDKSSNIDYGVKIVGKILAINVSIVTISGPTDNLFFKMPSDMTVLKLITGDWITCYLEPPVDKPVPVNHPKGHLDVVRVVPLVQKKVNGTVTHKMSRYLVINHEIYCPSWMYLGITVELDDPVSVDVIESDQEVTFANRPTQNFRWRAIHFSERITDHEFMDSMAMNEVTKYLSSPDLYQDKNGIVITKFLKFPTVKLEEESVLEIYLTNTGTYRHLLRKVTFVSTSQDLIFSVDWSSVGGISDGTPAMLKGGQRACLQLKCQGKLQGLIKQLCVFDFGTFQISRRAEVTVLTPMDSYQISNPPPTFDKYSYGRSNFIKPHCAVLVKADRPRSRRSAFSKLPLLKYEVPEEYWEAIKDQTNFTDIAPCLAEPLTPDNYIRKMSAMLYLEEIEQIVQIRQFDIPLTCFTRFEEWLSLDVPGLAESRPTVLMGDTVRIINPDFTSEDKNDYEGFVVKVRKSSVLLSIDRSFHSNYNGTDYTVQFNHSRTVLRRCHRAVQMAMEDLGAEVLFPVKLRLALPQVAYIECDGRQEGKKKSKACNEFSNGSTVSNVVDLKRPPHYYMPVLNKFIPPPLNVVGVPVLKWFAPCLNPEQKVAVKRVLEGSTRPLPYVIYGPPGTGKTVTLVEAILQINLLIPHSRVLVVTPSNSASDLLCERLIVNGKLTPSDLVRLIAFNRDDDSVPDPIKSFCMKITSTDDEAATAEMRSRLRLRIVIATAGTTGSLYNENLHKNHFTHVCVDEAGQLTEAETCIALALVDGISGQIILAGDPEQLGPIVQSKLAKRFGLEHSMLHRLCASVLYKPDQIKSAGWVYEPRLVTQLVKNYRSNPCILEVPSKLFYLGKLEALASEKIRNRLLGWPKLIDKSVPLLFHSIIGDNQQDADSPSWFNLAEAFKAVEYAKDLVDFGVEMKDIGIITPYRKQVEKIRFFLDNTKLGKEDIKVGSVEEFQGQERTAIILSTVRSTVDNLEDDVRHSLGFLMCRKRFNVAITRAMSLLVVVGNAQLLSRDPYWKELIGYCLRKGVLRGTHPCLE